MGAGAWGTALAKVLVDAGGPGTEVTLWARRPELAERINATRSNPDYLPGTSLPPGIHATADAGEALRDATTVLLGVPAQAMRANLERWAPLLRDRATLVSLAKGIELGTLMRMSQVIVSVTGVDPAQVAVISGPNLASEIAASQPAATVVACSDSGRAVALQRMLNSGYFRPYTNSDVVGTEIGGACKNVIALACGMAAGVGLGENTAAAIITRGWPRSCGWASRSAPRARRWPGWPGWATWSPPAARRTPATVRWASGSAAGQPSVRCSPVAPTAATGTSSRA